MQIKELRENFRATKLRYSLFNLDNQDSVGFDEAGKVIDGQYKTCHLLRIHNSDVVIRNTVFRGGDTSVIKKISNSDIKFPDYRCSIFGIIDGGAVIITGRSNVTFIKCTFEDNHSLMCGGAISNRSSGKVIVEDCKFINNSAGHTGSAIDNLTTGSNIEVSNCEFKTNQSNVWNKYDSPHGQITVFPETEALIKDCNFEEGSIPFDYKEGSKIELYGNNYKGYSNWNEDTLVKRKKNILDLMKIGMQLYWIPLKFSSNVYYRVNK